LRRFFQKLLIPFFSKNVRLAHFLTKKTSATAPYFSLQFKAERKIIANIRGSYSFKKVLLKNLGVDNKSFF